MRKKILLFGATGMAGHIAYYYLSSTRRYEIQDVVYRTPLTENSIIVNVTDKDVVAAVVRQAKPDIILNCVGVLIRGAQEHPDNAVYINAYFPHQLKTLADEIGARLIHISTDCVFSGKKGMYTEDDFRDADDIYGRSKALGEIINDKDLTLRTSIIGPELKKKGEGLFNWFMQQSDKVLGYKTAIWGGVTTVELAKIIDYGIQNDLRGLIHLSNGEGINKYDLLCLFREIWGKEIEIEAVNKNGVDKSIKRSNKLNFEIPSYRQMLEDLKEWMDCHSDLYKSNYQ